MNSRISNVLINWLGDTAVFEYVIKDWSRRSFWYRYKAIIVVRTADGFITQDRLFRTHRFARMWVLDKRKEYGECRDPN